MTRSPRALVVGTLVLVQINLAAQAPQTRDSAEVRIVDNPARTTFPVNLALGNTPLFDVGGLHDDEPGAEFDSRSGYLRGVRLSDGGLVVIDVTTVKYFDAGGRLLKVAGRAGDGPGEFRSLTSICRTHGDTIVVADRSRLGVLDKRGTFIRHIPSTPRHLPFDGCFNDGTLLLLQSEYRTPTPTTSTVHLWRVRLDGTLVTSLGDVVVSATDLVTQSEVTWAAAGSRLFLGDGTRREVTVFQLPTMMSKNAAASPPMKQVGSIRSADPTGTISEGDLERRIALTIPTNVSAAERAARIDQRKSAPHATTWPVIGRIYVDPDGNLWVADYLRVYPAPTGYSKFDTRGRLVGRLILPAATTWAERIDVIGFGRDDILVRRQDDDGASHLTVYPIVPTSSRDP